MKRKFSIMGLVNVVFWAISIGFFLNAVWYLFAVAAGNQMRYYQSTAEGNYAMSIILFFLTNPKVWEFVKNKIFK
ncbi:hypothetical protein MY985_05565 [Haemophilus influenzae]|uniref:hypothetical protein n=1 Tax=Haemophilus influenzae TaxID=727 RepID=UPI000E56F23E|nr:hypothetical protein [Haemophilus influenzae]MCK9065504.1 hypothetical protein [Haemophilus influenzae]